MNSWQPTASLNALKCRAQTYKTIRDFFEKRGVLEVETPILGEAATVDPHIDSLITEVLGQKHYLQTSPEFYLKRLLAAGSGDVYSLGKVFRQGERGRRHQPEFTLLEWYRIGWDEQQLIQEVGELLQLFLPDIPMCHMTYRQCFLDTVGFDPHVVSVADIKAYAKAHIDIDVDVESVSDWRDIVMTHCVEPQLPAGLVFIDDYPKEQAALARLAIDAQGQCVALRFEVYLNGIELANGYYELNDGAEQARRFQADQRYRQHHRLPNYPYDKKLVAALDHGMPECAGVAIGVDRLLMALLEVHDIRKVVSFAR